MSHIEAVKNTTISMHEMKPCQVGIIVDDDGGDSSGHIDSIVMRTSSVDKFEVMNLSDFREDGCWLSGNNLKVRLLKEGETINFILCND